MNLSAPKNVTWVIAVILGLLGFLGNFEDIAGLRGFSFWLLVLGFAILAVATFIDGL